LEAKGAAVLLLFLLPKRGACISIYVSQCFTIFLVTISPHGQNPFLVKWLVYLSKRGFSSFGRWKVRFSGIHFLRLKQSFFILNDVRLDKSSNISLKNCIAIQLYTTRIREKKKHGK